MSWPQWQQDKAAAWAVAGFWILTGGVALAFYLGVL